jgi:ubiquinone/menaquinone biosynthesis C-methylase UbiE
VDEDLGGRYYLELGGAFARGRLPELAHLNDEDAFREGAARGLRMHKFKRNADLPRVRRVLSMLTGLFPETLLDVGSGRGTFLWPLLDAFPSLGITAIDVDEQRASDLESIVRGGVGRLRAARMDAASLTYSAGSFDAATLLEVLEHVPRPELVVREAVRVARRFVIATVPSKPDDNPEHVRLFDRAALTELFEHAGAPRVRIEFVPNHIVALALLGDP